MKTIMHLGVLLIACCVSGFWQFDFLRALENASQEDVYKVRKLQTQCITFLLSIPWSLSSLGVECKMFNDFIIAMSDWQYSLQSSFVFSGVSTEPFDNAHYGGHTNGEIVISCVHSFLELWPRDCRISRTRLQRDHSCIWTNWVREDVYHAWWDTLLRSLFTCLQSNSAADIVLLDTSHCPMCVSVSRTSFDSCTNKHCHI